MLKVTDFVKIKSGFYENFRGYVYDYDSIKNVYGISTMSELWVYGSNYT